MDSAEIQAQPEPSFASDDAKDKPRPSVQDACLAQLWRQSGAEGFGLGETPFAEVLCAIGAKYNNGLPPGQLASAAQRETFYRTLQVHDLALAQACARGHEQAWQAFLAQYQSALTRMAIAMTHSTAMGEDLAGSLYSELFGLSERHGVRRSPLASYSGRGSLMGWLRTTLAQRHVDRHRRNHRETPIEEDFAAQVPETAPPTAALANLERAVNGILRTLAPEERFLLLAYFLDGNTLQQIARLLRVHEATVSRKLKRLTADLRKRLLKELERSGMSRRAAEETLGIDPRDLTVNLRNLLQTSVHSTFSQQAGPAS